MTEEEIAALQRLYALRRNFEATFHDGLKDVRLDYRDAFVCWNIIMTLLDMFQDARKYIRDEDLPTLDRSLRYQGFTAEELLEFVGRKINPRVRNDKRKETP